MADAKLVLCSEKVVSSLLSSDPLLWNRVKKCLSEIPH